MDFTNFDCCNSRCWYILLDESKFLGESNETEPEVDEEIEQAREQAKEDVTEEEIEEYQKKVKTLSVKNASKAN